MTKKFMAFVNAGPRLNAGFYSNFTLEGLNRKNAVSLYIVSA